MKLYEKTASELSEMLRSKECSALEIFEDVENRIKSVEDRVGAYITLTPDIAKKRAIEVDESFAKGEKLNVLAGIPIGIKDNISTKGIRTSCASKMLENYVPPFNATVIEKINNAGMVIMGKTNLDEFAMGSSTETSYMHITRNPHDLDRIPGGSSGGSTAAVAAGEAILTLGSDTGGSIRQPAALCGAIGLKPTYGSVSRYGLIAAASSLDQIGPIGRSVKDIAMLQDLISGYDKMDATSKNIEYPNLVDNLTANVKGMKIAVLKEFFGVGVDDSIKESVYKAIKMYEENGAEIKEISLPSTEFAIGAYHIIASAEASSNLARFDGVKYGLRAKEYNDLTDMYEKTRSEGFGDEVKRRIMLGTFVLSSGNYDVYYKKAKNLQKKVSEEFEEAFVDFDVIISPTVASTASKIGEDINHPVKMYYNDSCTIAASIAGLPAITLPCGKDGNNLPIGLQLIGNKFSEQTLLNAAYTYENLCGGFNVLSQTL